MAMNFLKSCVIAALWPAALAAQEPSSRTDLLGDPIPPGAVARLGSVRLRMGGYALSVAFSPDSKYVAAGGRDQLVHVWEAQTGKEVTLIKGHDGSVTAVRFFPDGKTLASAGHDGTIRIWDLATRRELRSFGNPNTRLLNIAITPDGKHVIATNLDKAIRSWDVAIGKAVKDLATAPSGYAELLALTGDGKQLVWGGTTQGLNLVELATGKAQLSLQPKLSMVQGLACSADGKRIAWGGSPAGVRIVDVATGKEERQLAKTQANIRAIAFSPDGKMLASSGHDLRVRLWDVDSGKEIRVLEGSSGFLLTVVFSPDGKLLAAAGPDSWVQLWDVASGKLLHDVAGHRGAVQAVAFTPDGKTVLTGSSDRLVRLWDPATARERCAGLAGHGGPVAGLIVSADGKTAYSAGLDQSVLAWKLDPERPGDVGKVPLRRFTGIPWPGFQIDFALAPDGKLLAATDNRNAAFIWDTATAKVMQTLTQPKEPRRGVAFSPDGRTVALRTRDGLLVLWDLASGKERQLIGKSTGTGPFAFSPDGRAILAMDNEVHLWEVATGRERCHFQVTAEMVPCLTVSPTGRLFALGGEESAIRVHDARTGKEVARLAGHLGAVHALVFAPDGRQLVSGGADTTALVWDVAKFEAAAQRRAVALDTGELDVLWQKLLETDAVKAHEAIGTLATSPKTAVPFLQKHIGAQTWADPRQIPKLIADLDDDKFEVRESASKTLEELGETAEPHLRKALEGAVSAEVRTQAQALLARAKTQGLPIKKARVVRALEVLEQIGTPAARATIEELARNQKQVWLQQEAEATLERWARRKLGAN